MATKRTNSRRTFLKQAAALAVPAIVPASVVAAAGNSVAPSNRINVGMIGMGRQAVAYNVKAFLGSADTQVVAVCDVDRWRLENAQKSVDAHYAKLNPFASFKGCASYGDFHDLLADKDIDAVMISTPDHWHVPIAIAAAESGKHIACEKPLTRTIAEGRKLADMVKQKGLVFRLDSEFRSKENFHRMAELVRNGRLGKIHTITAGVPGGDVGCGPQPEMPVPAELDYPRWLGPAPKAPYTLRRVHPRMGYGRPGWMRVTDYCDGMILNWGTHLCDIAQWCNGTDRTGPVEVEGHGTYPPAESFWNVLLSFEVKYRFANGVKMIYKTGGAYVQIEGEAGSIHGRFPRGLTAEPESLLAAKIGENEIHFPLKSEKADFIDAIKSGGATLEDAEVGHRTASLCHLGNIAIQVGERLTWDPDAERFVDNDAANRFVDVPIRR